jgi:hypothetical protein
MLQFRAETRVAQWVRSLDLTAHTIPSPIRCGFAPSFVNYKKGCTRLAAASDKVYQLLVQGRWFSPASSTNKTDCHDYSWNTAESGIKTPNINQSIKINFMFIWSIFNTIMIHFVLWKNNVCLFIWYNMETVSYSNQFIGK